MEECDFCGKPADLQCGKCFQAVYCGKSCQIADFAEHSECECFHPSEMDPEHLQFEIGLELEHPEDGIDEINPVNSSILGNHESSLEWLIGARNRLRTKRKLRRNNRKIRKERRRKRQANRGRRTANKGVRRERVLNKEQGKRQAAEQREAAAQRQFGTRR